MAGKGRQVAGERRHRPFEERLPGSGGEQRGKILSQKQVFSTMREQDMPQNEQGNTHVFSFSGCREGA